MKSYLISCEADLGGGGGGGLTPTPLGFDLLSTQRVPSLYYFEMSIFDTRTLKFFKKRLWRQSILISKGERAQKKTRLLIKISKKNLKTLFF